MKVNRDLNAVMKFGRQTLRLVKKAKTDMAPVASAVIVVVLVCCASLAHASGDRAVINQKPCTKISEHFCLEEFNQKQGEPLPLDQVKVSPELIAKLEALRVAIGNKPIQINSGYRSPDYNEMVGGAKHSQHMDGKAADIVVRGMTAKQLEPIARSVGFTFTQTYTKYSHLHVDVR